MEQSVNKQKKKRNGFKRFLYETFRPHSKDEYAEFFKRGLYGETDGDNRVYPFMWARALLCVTTVFALILLLVYITGNSVIFPSVAVMGSLIVNVPFFVLLYELYPKRDISLVYILFLAVAGGVFADIVTLMLYMTADPVNGIVYAVWVGVVEETGKALPAIFLILLNRKKNPYIGFLTGAAVGFAFSVSEDLGYILGYSQTLFGVDFYNLVAISLSRGITSVCTHITWTAFIGWAFSRYKNPFKSVGFYLNFALSVILHALWDMPSEIIGDTLSGLLIIACAIVALVLLNRRIKKERYAAFGIVPEKRPFFARFSSSVYDGQRDFRAAGFNRPFEFRSDSTDAGVSFPIPPAADGSHAANESAGRGGAEIKADPFAEFAPPSSDPFADVAPPSGNAARAADDPFADIASATDETAASAEPAAQPVETETPPFAADSPAQPAAAAEAQVFAPVIVKDKFGTAMNVLFTLFLLILSVCSFILCGIGVGYVYAERTFDGFDEFRAFAQNGQEMWIEPERKYDIVLSGTDYATTVVDGKLVSATQKVEKDGVYYYFTYEKIKGGMSDRYIINASEMKLVTVTAEIGEERYSLQSIDVNGRLYYYFNLNPEILDAYYYSNDKGNGFAAVIDETEFYGATQTIVLGAIGGLSFLGAVGVATAVTIKNRKETKYA